MDYRSQSGSVLKKYANNHQPYSILNFRMTALVAQGMVTSELTHAVLT